MHAINLIKSFIIEKDICNQCANRKTNNEKMSNRK